MNIFKPTHLYIKQHSVTGMYYFGKTTRSEKFLLEKYNGSGKHWSNHLKKHGSESVKTIWYELFNDIDELTEFALFFSEEMNIVKSKKWANEKVENGLGGSSIGRPGWIPADSTRELWKKQRTGRITKDSTKKLMSEQRSGNKNPFYNKIDKEHPLYGFKHTEEEKQNRSLRASKQFKITSPAHEELIVINLTRWCKENNINYFTVYNQLKGWKCQLI
jgi:hypothetical protein